MSALLSVRALTAGYGGVPVIEAIDLEVEEHGVVVIIGPNGAGKSTLLKSIFALTEIASGSIVFGDRDITQLPTAHLVPIGIAAVPQNRNVFPSLTVFENLEVGTYAAPPKDGARTIAKVLALFPDLAGKLKQPAGELSGGQRQMVAIARALMSEPKLLLLDEPTAGLSPAYLEIIFDLILDIARNGVTILMVEQNAKQALRIADRAHVLVNGRNFMSGSGAALLADDVVRRSFLGGRAVIEFVNLYLVPALTLGSIYALGAVGISMIFGILRFAHFAHGDVMTIGAFGVLTAVWVLPIHPLLLMPFGVALAVVSALAADHWFYRPLRKLPTIYTVIASFGVALMLRSLAQILWGADNQVYVAGVTMPVVLFDTFRISALHAEAILLTIAIAVVLHFFLTRSRTGRAMRAVADDPELAAVAGLDTERVIRATWIIGAALAAVAGVFAAMDTDVHPNLGWNLLLSMFAAAVLGGIGKPMGAMAGGLVIGLAEELSTYNWIGERALVSPSYKSAVGFGIMVVLLIFRPQGLFKGRLL